MDNDRNKVIKKLEWFRDRENWREGIMNYDDHAEVRERICIDAINLLKADDELIYKLRDIAKMAEEQMTEVEPDMTGLFFTLKGSMFTVLCGKCHGEMIKVDPFTDVDYMKRQYQFCHHCGKKVKWT